MRALDSCVCLALLVGSGCTSSGAADRTQPTSAAVTAGTEPAGAGATGAADPRMQGTPANALPAAFKGYELYAWDAAGALEFTLITGTNRAKTVAEIEARDRSTTDGDFVIVTGQGLPALQQLLDRIPDGTEVILSQLPGLPALGTSMRGEVQRLIDGR